MAWLLVPENFHSFVDKKRILLNVAAKKKRIVAIINVLVWFRVGLSICDGIVVWASENLKGILLLVATLFLLWCRLLLLGLKLLS